MRIAVNTRFLIAGHLEGIGWFTYQTLKRIVQQHPEHEFYFIFDRPFSSEFIFAPNVTPVIVRPPARHPLLWYVWFELSIPRILKKLKADVFLSTDGFLSLSTKIPTLLVIHDIAFEHFPTHVNRLAQKYYRHFTPLYAKKAARIATVSSYTKADVMEKYGVNDEKIDVVFNGINENYKPISEQDKLDVRESFSAGKEFFIFAGALQPRKNVARLLKAFNQFKEETSADVNLLIVGRRGWNCDDIFEEYELLKYKNSIFFLGHKSAEELARLTAAAIAMVYPSLFEGFGIPIVEAMAAGVPVITSNVSSMPEVAGDAAILVEPLKIESITLAMKEVYQDEELRQQMIQKGNIQSTKFSWDKTAERLWQNLLKIS